MKYIGFIFLALLISGCSSTDSSSYGSDTGSGEGVVVNGLDGVYSGGETYLPDGTSGYNAATDGDYYTDPSYGQSILGGPESPAKDRVIYFSFDSTQIDQRATAIVDAHARYLVANPNARVILEGHTDSRGSREYNIALGEERAKAVLNLFAARGVDPSRVRILSYGEERPAVQGYSEDAYKRNRRAVIQYN